MYIYIIHACVCVYTCAFGVIRVNHKIFEKTHDQSIAIHIAEYDNAV